MEGHQSSAPSISWRNGFSSESGPPEGSDSSATAHSGSSATAHSCSGSGSDLEKHVTLPPEQLEPAASHRRMSRVQTLTAQRHEFRHRLSKMKTGDDVIVDFDGPEDPYRPINWPMRKKIVTTAIYALTTTASTWSSSVYSPAVHQIGHQFHISPEVATLGIALLLAGFGIGPLVWAPLSEVFGRKAAVLPPVFIAALFSFGTGAAKDVQTIMITRFFAGFFASAPITNNGGVMGDIWHPTQRGIAIVPYSFGVSGGPMVSPIVGAAFVSSYLRWRWTEYLSGIIICFMFCLGVLILDETYPPRLLVYKARRLRVETGNWALHAKFEEWDISLKELAVKFCVRPFQMLLTPICFLMSLYVAFVYGMLYANFAAFPLEFYKERGWELVPSTLPFLGYLIGIFIGGGINVANQFYYNRIFEANGGKPVPEARLPPMMIGSVFFCAGIFLFGWTSDKSFIWVAPCFGAFFMGLGFFTIFQSAINYLIDTFHQYAASAMAASTFLRCAFAAAFPLFITPMYDNMGIDWGSSVFGFFSIALIPIPFLFHRYGKQIRARGRYSAELEE